MNPVVDIFSLGTASWMGDVVRSVLGDQASKSLVTYNSPADPTYSPTAGTATTALTSVSIQAWRGNPIETESPSPDVSTRQFVIMAVDLEDISPARGDFILDGVEEYGVERVERGEIGPAASSW